MGERDLVSPVHFVSPLRRGAAHPTMENLVTLPPSSRILAHSASISCTILSALGSPGQLPRAFVYTSETLTSGRFRRTS